MSGKDALARRETSRSPYPSFAKSPGGRRLFVLRMLRDRAAQAPRKQTQNKAS